MIMIMCSVYDSKVGVWSQPHLFVNKGAALRAWEEAANDPNSPFAKHPAEFTMFVIGEWDDSSGDAAMYQAKESLGTSLQFKRETRPQWTPEFADKQKTTSQEAHQ